MPALTPERLAILERETRFAFVRAKGPGGQAVNKKSTAVKLFWYIPDSQAFTDAEKELIRVAAGQRPGIEQGMIIISTQEERSQIQNKKRAIEIFYALLEKALEPVRERIPTKATRGSVQRRLGEKTQHGKLKQERRWKPDHE